MGAQAAFWTLLLAHARQQPPGSLPFPAAHIVWPNPSSSLLHSQFSLLVCLFWKVGGGRESSPLPLVERAVSQMVLPPRLQGLAVWGEGCPLRGPGQPKPPMAVIWVMHLNILPVVSVEYGQKWGRCECSVHHLCQDSLPITSQCPTPAISDARPWCSAAW